jgi:two-component system, NtrC family, sensor histidine kinase HydH
MATDRASTGHRFVFTMAALAIAIGSIALSSAVYWYGHPIAGVLVDANALVSNIGLSHWDGDRKGLRFPDQVLEVDGISLAVPGGGTRAKRFDRAVEDAALAGRISVSVRVATSKGERQLDLNIHRLEPVAWWTFGGGLFFSAALYAIAGLVALWVSRAALARSFGSFALSSSLFLFTLFDFHTSRILVPLFYLGFALLPVGLVMVPLRLPDDVRLLTRFPWLERAVYIMALAWASAMIAAYWLGSGATRVLQDLWTMLFAASFLFCVGAVLVRFFRASGTRRDILRALIIAIGPVYAVIGVFWAILPLGAWKIVAEVIAFPALSLSPIAIAYAFVRHDLFGSRALLSRILTNLLIGAVVSVLAIGLGSELAAQFGVSFSGALLAATVTGVAVAVTVPLSLRATERLLFRSRAAYKPTIEQLSEELTSITSPSDVARAMERTVRRWLPCDSVEVSLAENVSWLRSTEAMAADSGVRKVPVEQSGMNELSLAIRFADKDLGTLVVGPKRGGALFTHDDIDLLRTIVNQGALALAHAQAYQELEQRRRQQAAAWRGEREALVETVAAEIAHEVRFPINFFRTVFERAARGRPLQPLDVDIGREEVERLERLLAGLRRLAAHRLQRRPISLAELCEHAEVLLRDALGKRKIALEFELDAAIRCDVDHATQILVNLLSNALEAAPDAEIGITWTKLPTGGVLQVWDTGPGFVGDPARLFAPWYTTKPRGTGLGLSITQRLVKGHGWSIEVARREGKTIFSLQIPATDVVASEWTRQQASDGRAEVA